MPRGNNHIIKSQFARSINKSNAVKAYFYTDQSIQKYWYDGFIFISS